jgi:hypothetical protein
VEQEQIKQTYSVLCNRSGTTKINQPTFIQYWADYVDPIIADRLWLIFDTKFDSLLDFEEWSTGLSTTVRGNKEDRVKRTYIDSLPPQSFTITPQRSLAILLSPIRKDMSC